MNLNIKATMATGGWQEIRQMLENKKNGLRLPKNVNKNKDYKNIAIETLGKAYAVRIIDRWLKELDGINNVKQGEVKKRLI
jgi:hypothetical protein